MKKFILALGLIASSAPAFAGPVTADRMTCAQAVATYEKYKRIYVIAHGQNVLPIYGYKPISTINHTRCNGRQKTQVRKFVRTLDTNKCAIGWSCS